jgi:hypothetical protein
MAYDFNGTSDKLATADADRFSFGNGSTDSPFSIVAQVNMDDATNFYILDKDSLATGGREWIFCCPSGTIGGTNVTDCLTMLLISPNGAPFRGRATPAQTSKEGADVIFGGTYDGRGGTGAASGIKLFIDGVRADSTTLTSGTYVAMSNTATAPQIGARAANFADGRIGWVALWPVELTVAEMAMLGKGASPLCLTHRIASLVSGGFFLDLTRPLNYPGIGPAWTATGTTVTPQPKMYRPHRRRVA